MDSDPPKPKHDHEALIFPEGFLWGAATSAFQVEGGNIHSDWWEWEQTVQPSEKRSGQAANQYELYEQDFHLAKSLGHNSHRLSIEWSRIEPEEGRFDQIEIDHYVKVLKKLKELNFTVMLTLHHFTNPAWFAKKGGWENFNAPNYFERYVKKIIPEISEYVDFWITINEPGVLIWGGYLAAKWPPQKKSKWKALKAYWNLSQAHKKAYKTIHKITPKTRVGIANNLSSFDTFHHHSIREGIAEWFLDVTNNHFFYKLTGINTHDFLGVNYYFNNYISFNGETRFPSLVDVSTTKKDVSDLGWEIYPEGIFDIIMDLSDYHLPIYITENGLASTNDDRRVRVLLNYLKEIYHAIQTGADVRGYFHWSLVDNLELADGFTPRFGLVEIDYESLRASSASQNKTQSRKPRPSSYVYKEIIKHNGIPHDLLKLLGHGIKVEDVLKEDIEE